jgi:hypothetical protein
MSYRVIQPRARETALSRARQTRRVIPVAAERKAFAG